ncbi:MAG TPA: DUF3515 family protein [Mycobacteriales bacterium]|nr:DUF3515 family protein [Mycobacteriales bacterium]
MLGASACNAAAVSIDPPSPSGLVVESCDRLGTALPDSLGGLKVRPTKPRSSLTHAWGSPPVTLSCGVAKPSGYSPDSSSTLSVDNVQWYEQVGKDDAIWTAVRPTPLSANRIYVALIVPKSYQQGAAFLTALASPLKTTLD